MFQKPSLQASGMAVSLPLVWAVLLLTDLTVVTGDSTGHVCFYDGQLGALHRRFGSHQVAPV